MKEKFLQAALQKLQACRDESFAEGVFKNSLAVVTAALDTIEGSWDDLARRWPDRKFTHDVFMSWSMGRDLPEMNERQEIVIRLQKRLTVHLSELNRVNTSVTLPKLAAVWDHSAQNVAFADLLSEHIPLPSQKPKSPQQVRDEEELRHAEVRALHGELWAWRGDLEAFQQNATSFCDLFGTAALKKLFAGSGISDEALQRMCDGAMPTVKELLPTLRRELSERMLVSLTLWIMDKGKFNMSRWASVIEAARKILTEAELQTLLKYTKAEKTQLSMWAKYFGRSEAEVQGEKSPDALIVHRVTAHLHVVLTKRLRSPWKSFANK